MCWHALLLYLFFFFLLLCIVDGGSPHVVDGIIRCVAINLVILGLARSTGVRGHGCIPLRGSAARTLDVCALEIDCKVLDRLSPSR
ncbi:hypothetical protein OG21DRAFT_1504215 [Imleria badia]|nr:hypothetical protein OG21DRAFT_1504215 [Imleria badia]